MLGPRGEDAAPSMVPAAWDSHSHNSDPHASAHTDAPQQARNPGTPTWENTALTLTSSHHASTPRKRRPHGPSQQLPQNGTNTPMPQA
ncbi:hypothetical protein FKM82_028396 [Ascaphus truei]